MARIFTDSEAFLSHRLFRTKLSYFNKWKRRNPPIANLWLHTKLYPIAFWRHQFPKISSYEKDGQKVRRVFSQPYNCYEDESLLREQSRLDDNGKREYPPTKCPACKFIEYVRGEVVSGRLSWTDPVLTHHDDDGIQTVHAGGLYGAFNDRISDTERSELQTARVSLREAWRQNAMPRLNYLFLVVDNDEPQAGIQVAIETSLVGQMVQELIKDTMISFSDGNPGSEKLGNPFINPYCVQWEHRKNAIAFGDRYKTRAMPRLKVSPEILGLIKGEPPNIDSVIEPFDPIVLRTQLEGHCVLKNVPWDEIFQVNDAPKLVSMSSPKALPAPKDIVVDRCELCHKTECDHVECDHVECDHCGKAISVEDSSCAHCGIVYEKFGDVAVDQIPF